MAREKSVPEKTFQRIVKNAGGKSFKAIQKVQLITDTMKGKRHDQS